MVYAFPFSVKFEFTSYRKSTKNYFTTINVLNPKSTNLMLSKDFELLTKNWLNIILRCYEK